jgi:hypothetical protein
MAQPFCVRGFAPLCASAGCASLRRSLRAENFSDAHVARKMILIYSRLASRELCETPFVKEIPGGAMHRPVFPYFCL